MTFSICMIFFTVQNFYKDVSLRFLAAGVKTNFLYCIRPLDFREVGSDAPTVSGNNYITNQRFDIYCRGEHS